jgi:beta-galactosidase
MTTLIHARKNAIAAAASACLATFLAACGGGGSGDSALAFVQGEAIKGMPATTQADAAGWRFAATLDEVRSTTLLDKLAWRFIQDDSLTDEAGLANDASSWTSVTLPHSWNENDAASTAQTTPSSVPYKRGKGWYRLEFDSPGAGATQWLQFDGVSIVADVWLNGQKLGQHRGAFTRFRFDVTGKLKPGRNVLVVKADNSAPTSGADPTAIVPLSGDFNMSGGLYRSVSLVSTPHPVHFVLDDLGSFGIFARTTALNEGRAKVNVRAMLKNDSMADGSYTVQVTLLEADGETIKSANKQSFSVKAGAQVEAAQDITVARPHLWQGVNDPYLYKLVVEIKDEGGSTIDKVVQDYGIREMKFDPAKGFFLNGKSFPLHGVNLHQDYQGKAWAISKEQTDESLGLIKEIGANTVRLAHYPHAQYTLEQADKMGFVVWAELPFVNTTVVPCTAGVATAPALVENAKQQLQELIRQQYNHTSIATWSVGNETTQGCGLPANAVPVLKALHALAKVEDPSRPTTLASNKDNDQIGGITDIWAQNQYFMWYTASPVSVLGTLLDGLRASFPVQPVGISEYGAGAALSHQSDNVNDAIGSVVSFDVSGKTRTVYQPESYASLVHEANYGLFLTKEYLWGTYVWNMFDFGSGIRHEGDIGATNTKGLVSFDRKTKKDAFYFYKAHWSRDPVTYITGRRYVDRNLPAANVKVYSNADSVTLSVNGRAIKTLTAADCQNKTCNFGEVPLTVGDNTVVAIGSAGGKTFSDTVVWKLDGDHATNLYIAAGQVTTGFFSEANGALGLQKRFASDNYFTGGIRKNLPFGTGPGQLAGPLANVGTSGVPAEGRVWDAYREELSGGFSYDFSLVPGKSYLVKLGFLEPSLAAGQRTFDVRATTGGATLTPIQNLDVAASASGVGAALVRQFPVTIGADGKLRLDFVGRTGKAMVSNIMVVQQ